MARTTHLRRVPTPVKPAPLVAADGGRAELVGEAIEFRDREGRLLVRYENGTLEIAPASGDLRLRAPAGRVEIEGMDVAIRASRDVVVAGARRADLTASVDEEAELAPRVRVEREGPKLTGRAVEIRAQRMRSVVAKAELLATAVRTSATTIETHARKIDTTAERVTLRAKELAEQVADLLETRAGRVRSLVKGAFSLRTKTVNMKSEEDTSIDGRRVLLG